MGEPALREITLEITQECLNRCVYCSSMAGQDVPHQPMSLTVIRRLLREASELGLKSLSLSGGEPFLHPKVSAILEHCSRIHLDNLMIYTSGVVRSKKGSPEPLGASMIEMARQVGAVLVFNIQSTCERIHDHLTGYEGRFNIALQSLRRAIDSGATVECHIVPNRINVSSLFDTAHELLHMGVRRISFLRLVRQGRAAHNWSALELDQGDLAELDRQLTDLFREPQSAMFYRFGVPFSRICGRKMVCQAGISKILIRWDGLCFPCEAFKESGNDSYLVGNIHVNSVSQIVRMARNNPALRILKCRSCGIDVCPAQVLYSTGGIR